MVGVGEEAVAEEAVLEAEGEEVVVGEDSEEVEAVEEASGGEEEEEDVDSEVEDEQNLQAWSEHPIKPPPERFQSARFWPQTHWDSYLKSFLECLHHFQMTAGFLCHFCFTNI